jgi:hypothetical protein
MKVFIYTLLKLYISYNFVSYTGWSKSACAPDDYNTESYK